MSSAYKVSLLISLTAPPANLHPSYLISPPCVPSVFVFIGLTKQIQCELDSIVPYRLLHMKNSTFSDHNSFSFDLSDINKYRKQASHGESLILSVWDTLLVLTGAITEHSPAKTTVWN